MATRLDQYNERLELYLAAEKAILEGAQSYSIYGRNLTRANLADIRVMIDHLENKVSAETARVSGKGRNRVTGIVPRDI